MYACLKAAVAVSLPEQLRNLFFFFYLKKCGQTGQFFLKTLKPYIKVQS